MSGDVTRDVAKLLGLGSTRRPGSDASPAPVLRVGVVTRVDPDGSVWLTPLDGDARAPLGPVRGARRPVLVTNAGGSVELRWLPLPARTEVLFTSTTRGVWVVRADTTEGI